MADIVMPRLSDTMEEGTILRWLGHDGEEIRRGQELVEIETDKATMVYESDQQGTLEIVAQEGQTLAVGELIARVGVAGADGASERAPASTARVDGEGPAPGGPAGVPAGAVPPQADSGPAPVSPRADERERVKASPLARRIARERGIDLGTLSGTGPDGRIVAEDVERAAAAPAPERAPAPTAAGEVERVPLTSLRKTIARRLTEAWEAPVFQLGVSVDMERAQAVRAKLVGELAREELSALAGLGAFDDRG